MTEPTEQSLSNSEIVPDIPSSCIQILALCIHLSSRCYISEALRPFLNCFIVFSKLNIIPSPIKINEKWSEKALICAEYFLYCVNMDIKFLKGEWMPILRTISQIDKNRKRLEFDLAGSEIDSIFNSTIILDRENLLDLVTCLEECSRKELHEHPPRSFSLLKLADVGQLNIINQNSTRTIYDWNLLWNKMSEYLIEVGSGPNLSAALTSVSIIYQLSQKILEKPEESSFHSQAAILQPYLTILNLNLEPHVVSLILDCITDLIH